MAFASIAAIGTAVSAIGSIFGAIQGMQAASYNAAVAEQNAELARRQGELERERIDRESRQRLGSIRAAYGANNIATEEGSPLDVLDYSFREAERDKANVEYDAAIRAYGYQATAQQQRFQGRSALVTGLLDAGGTVANFAGQSSASSTAPQGYGASVSPNLISRGFIPAGY